MTAPERFPVMTASELGDQLAAAVTAPDGEVMARLAAVLGTRAAREGLLDVAYARADSPVGTLTICATPRGVVRVAFDNEPEDQVLSQLAARVSPRILHTPARLDGVRRELDEYFAGQRKSFGLAVDWALTAGFRRQVLAAAARIPYGRTVSYRLLAAAAGSPNAYRAAGSALAANPVPIIVPCHRVLPASGTVGQYRGGPGRKQHLLDLERANR
jgi:methylated-DNA-[protein]-cysteine S-methyltransferase